MESVVRASEETPEAKGPDRAEVHGVPGASDRPVQGLALLGRGCKKGAAPFVAVIEDAQLVLRERLYLG